MKNKEFFKEDHIKIRSTDPRRRISELNAAATTADDAFKKYRKNVANKYDIERGEK